MLSTTLNPLQFHPPPTPPPSQKTLYASSHSHTHTLSHKWLRGWVTCCNRLDVSWRVQEPSAHRTRAASSTLHTHTCTYTEKQPLQLTGSVPEGVRPKSLSISDARQQTHNRCNVCATSENPKSFLFLYTVRCSSPFFSLCLLFYFPFLTVVHYD